MKSNANNSLSDLIEAKLRHFITTIAPIEVSAFWGTSYLLPMYSQLLGWAQKSQKIACPSSRLEYVTAAYSCPSV